MFCPNCGKENNDSAKFCKHCGQKIQQSVAAKSEETATDYLWGYRFKHGTGLDLKSIQEAIEKKSDYKIIDHDAIKYDVFVYQKGSGKNPGLIVFTKKGDEVIILGNDKGLVSARSRFINRKFKKPYKEKIAFNEMGKPLLQAVKEHSVPQGSEKDSISGVAGWLAFFIIGIFISAAVNIFSSLAAFSGWAAIDLALGIYGAYIGYQLVKIKPGVRKHVKIYLISVMVVGLVVWMYLDQYISTPEIEEAKTSSIRAIFYGAIWLWYFGVSKRVKATYTD